MSALSEDERAVKFEAQNPRMKGFYRVNATINHPRQEEWPTHGSIQWKGTDVCMDVRCKCGYQDHVDADFFYVWLCPDCKTRYAVGATVELLELQPDELTAWPGYHGDPLVDHEEAKSSTDEPKPVEEPQGLLECTYSREKFNYVCNWMLKLSDGDAATIYPILNQIRQAHKA